MSIGDPITDPVPPVGTAGTSYASQLVAFLAEVKTRLTAKVPLSSLLIGLLDMANNALANVAYLALYNRASQPTTPTGSLQNYNNDLWWVSGAGAMQLTNGLTLNATSIDGFGGDYGSPNPASANFVDADETYKFYDDAAATKWAWLRARGIEVAAGATSAIKARIQFAGAGSYTLALPTALPGAQVLVQLDAAGQLTPSNTLAANQSITLSGTGDYKHGDKQFTNFIGAGAFSTSGALSYSVWTAGPPITYRINIAGSGIVVFPILGLKVGDRIKTIVIRGSSANDGTCTVTDQLYDTATDMPYTSSGAFNTTGSKTLNITTPVTIAAGHQVFVKIAAGAGAIDLTDYTVTIDR